LAVVFIAFAIAVIALLDRDAELFGPSVATMAGIYLVAFADGRPWTAWVAFVVLSAVVSVLQVLRLTDVLDDHPGIGMALVLVLLWLWAVARRRFTDGGTFSVQTAGMLGFGAITLLCAVAQPRLGAALAGVGFLAHGIWDAYHFKADKVVNRPWSEFCAVIDLPVGVALIVAAAA
jgi:CDP-diglyceride synthetase